jgi:hypothetical protein
MTEDELRKEVEVSRALQARQKERYAGLLKLNGIQAQNGTWDASPYMTGLANGLELAVATLDDRRPVYKNIQQPATGSCRECRVVGSLIDKAFDHLEDIVEKTDEVEYAQGLLMGAIKCIDGGRAEPVDAKS